MLASEMATDTEALATAAQVELLRIAGEERIRA